MHEDTTAASADSAPSIPEDQPTVPPADFGQELESFEKGRADVGSRSVEPAVGDKISGTIMRVGDDHAIVDFGGRSEGVIEVRHLKNPAGVLKHGVGDVVELYVMNVGDTITLAPSLKPEAKAATNQLRESMKSKVPVSGRVVAVRAGGLQVDIAGVRSFCPLSQIESGYCSDPSVYVGKTLEFMVTEVHDGRRGAVVSRKSLLRRDSEEQGKKLLDSIKPGDSLEGTVVRLEGFGAFIDLGGVDGLVHVSEIRHERTTHPKDALSEGQKVQVKVLRIEPGKDGRPRIGLSIKAAAPDPWQGITERFFPGKRVQGSVARLTDFGAFVALETGIDGLVHVSEVSRERVAHVKDVLTVGQSVDAVVITADADKRRVSLSIREAQALDAGETIQRTPPAAGRGPREGGAKGGPRGGGRVREAGPVSREPSIGEAADGTVASVKPFGVFIDLPAFGPRARGLLPVEAAGVPRGEMESRYPVGSAVSVVVSEMREGKIRVTLPGGVVGGGGGGGRKSGGGRGSGGHGGGSHGNHGGGRNVREVTPPSDEPTTMAIALRKAMEKAREREQKQNG